MILAMYSVLAADSVSAVPQHRQELSSGNWLNIILRDSVRAADSVSAAARWLWLARYRLPARLRWPRANSIQHVAQNVRGSLWVCTSCTMTLRWQRKQESDYSCHYAQRKRLVAKTDLKNGRPCCWRSCTTLDPAVLYSTLNLFHATVPVLL